MMETLRLIVADLLGRGAWPVIAVLLFALALMWLASDDGIDGGRWS